jgi:hypothetical protein
LACDDAHNVRVERAVSLCDRTRQKAHECGDVRACVVCVLCVNVPGHHDAQHADRSAPELRQDAKGPAQEQTDRDPRPGRRGLSQIRAGQHHEAIPEGARDQNRGTSVQL